MPEHARLERAEFEVDARTLARRLIGCRLVRAGLGNGLLAGTIVETEAYVGTHDQASHAFRGRRTQRNESMYQRGGTAYVYFTYGAHFCMNVVCGREGVPVAVLIRALEPLSGLEVMRERRFGEIARRGSDIELCNGPGKLCRAMGIDRGLDGEDLVTSERMWIERGEGVRLRLVNTPRIGIDSAGVWTGKKLRWYAKDSRHVTRSKHNRVGKVPLQRLSVKNR